MRRRGRTRPCWRPALHSQSAATSRSPPQPHHHGNPGLADGTPWWAETPNDLKRPEALRHSPTPPSSISIEVTRIGHKTLWKWLKSSQTLTKSSILNHFCISKGIRWLPEAPHALSLHWSKKIPFGPSFPESSVSQNFLPVSSCYMRHKNKERSSLIQEKVTFRLHLLIRPSRPHACTQKDSLL